MQSILKVQRFAGSSYSILIKELKTDIINIHHIYILATDHLLLIPRS